MILSKIKQEAEPLHGDYKIIKKFAWLPKKVNGYKIWLEPYKIIYEYQIKKRFVPLSNTGIVFEGTWGEWEIISIKRAKKA